MGNCKGEKMIRVDAQNLCLDCGHRHRGKNECVHCDCVWEPVILKTVSWWQKILNWFK